MALPQQQEEGWPLGLQPLNVRAGLLRNPNRNLSGSTSFNTLLSRSVSSSTDSSSSDLDTESTGSFFHDGSTTLGSLIGVSRIVNLSRRSFRRPSNQEVIAAAHKNYKFRPWCLSLCPTNTTDAETGTKTTPSLGQFLAVERRAATEHRKSHSTLMYGGADELSLNLSHQEPNSLFVDGHGAPPHQSPCSGSDDPRRKNSGLEHGNGQGVPVMFPCMCG